MTRRESCDNGVRRPASRAQVAERDGRAAVVGDRDRHYAADAA